MSERETWTRKVKKQKANTEKSAGQATVDNSLYFGFRRIAIG